MDRSDILLVSLGGGGNRLVDTILKADQRFQGLFVNTSMTDIESLDNYNPLTKNFLCISQQNGVGRNRDIGKSYAEQYKASIAEKIMKYQQETIYLVSTLGGGSGSSILSTTLGVLRDIKNEGALDKIINLICVIPDSKSPSIILQNALETWDEVLAYQDVFNSMIFINNECKSHDDELTQDEKEVEINIRFAKMFDAIFDIPEYNGVNFDNGNLGNILNDKGCLYIYDLADNSSNISFAMREAERNSVLASVYRTQENTVIVDPSKNLKAMKCGYLGISLSNENYNAQEILENYYVRKEPYIGLNQDKNLVLVSGCLPPSSAMEVLYLELKERRNAEKEEVEVIPYKSFSVNKNNNSQDTFRNKDANVVQNDFGKSSKNDALEQNKKLKKVLKKSLFKGNL